MTRHHGNLGTRESLRWQYAGAAGVFLVLILGIIFLFGHLISGSLSRRYLEDVLAGGRTRAAEVLEQLGVRFTAHVSSAHRTPERTLELVREAEADGCSVMRSCRRDRCYCVPSRSQASRKTSRNMSSVRRRVWVL